MTGEGQRILEVIRAWEIRSSGILLVFSFKMNYHIYSIVSRGSKIF